MNCIDKRLINTNVVVVVVVVFPPCRDSRVSMGKTWCSAGLEFQQQTDRRNQTNKCRRQHFPRPKKKKSVIQKSMWMTNDPTIGIVMKPVQLETGLPSSSSSTKKNYLKKKNWFLSNSSQVFRSPSHLFLNSDV